MKLAAARFHTIVKALVGDALSPEDAATIVGILARLRRRRRRHRRRRRARVVRRRRRRDLQARRARRQSDRAARGTQASRAPATIARSACSRTRTRTIDARRERARVCVRELAHDRRSRDPAGREPVLGRAAKKRRSRLDDSREAEVAELVNEAVQALQPGGHSCFGTIAVASAAVVPKQLLPPAMPQHQPAASRAQSRRYARRGSR